MQWIDVQERMPNQNMIVLIYITEFNEVSIGYWCIQSNRPWDKDAVGILQWFDITESNCCWDQPARQVSHWMPLPDEPFRVRLEVK